MWEIANFIIERIETQVGIEQLNVSGLPVYSAFLLFLSSMFLSILGGVMIKKLLLETRDPLVETHGLSRSAWRFGQTYKLMALSFLEFLWVGILIFSLLWVLSASPF